MATLEKLEWRQAWATYTRGQPVLAQIYKTTKQSKMNPVVWVMTWERRSHLL